MTARAGVRPDSTPAMCNASLQRRSALLLRVCGGRPFRPPLSSTPSGTCRAAPGKRERETGRKARGLLASLPEFGAFAADGIQMYLKINSARLPLPFTPGDGFFLQATKNTSAKGTCVSLPKERAIHL